MLKKRGQLTLFIILGIVILAAVIAVLFFYRADLADILTPKTSPDTFEYCAKQGVDEIVTSLAPTAGFIGTYFNKTYNSIAIPYVCYTDEYYKPCVVQVPFLEERFKASLRAELETKVNDCYNDYLDEFKRQGYDVTAGDVDIEMDLQKDKIKISVSAPTTVSEEGLSSSSQDFEFEIPTKIYDVIMMANNIVKFETTYGEYELVQSLLLYPDMPVNAFKLGDGTIIYVINSGETKYQFAVRSYVSPPGYGI